jgi:hypothetical protein
VDVTSHPARWRIFADSVAAALGLNVWVSVVLLPGLFVDAWVGGPGWIAAVLPLGVLLVGLWRRSDTLLLFGFPSALLIPAAFFPEIVNRHVYGSVRFTIVATSVIAYLFSASFLSSFRAPAAPASIRTLSSATRPVPERWRRRYRVYRGLVALSVSCPLVLVYAVNFDPASRGFMRELFPGRIAALSTLLNLAVLGFWLALYYWVFLGVLRPHRTGDRDLVVELSLLRSQARRGRPRPVFYVGVGSALGFMLLLLLLR